MNLPVDSANRPPRRTRIGGVLLLSLLLALALGAGGWYGWRQWQAGAARAQALAEQQRDAAEIARIRDLYTHRPSPTMRTSGLSCTPCTRWTVAITY